MYNINYYKVWYLIGGFETVYHRFFFFGVYQKCLSLSKHRFLGLIPVSDSVDLDWAEKCAFLTGSRCC